MNFLQVGIFLAATSFSLAQPSHDYWGEYGPYGPCSRTCGTGVAMRSRQCITSRRDGGHNCVGASTSYRTCNLLACPPGARDFREEQCSHFDRQVFQGKRHTWLPYYGATNPCELNCIPRGDTFVYRHRPSVADGTPCYVGRGDICVEGVCRVLGHGEIVGINLNSPALVTPLTRETRSYAYTYTVWSRCSVPCNGGMQTRNVHCIVAQSGVQTPPDIVDDTYCIAQQIQRPTSRQACNMHQCAAAEYSVSSFSVCSVTCGEGQQTREVFCVGAGGVRMADHSCSGLTRPSAVQACRKPACHIRMAWHVTSFGLCTRSCGGGVRDRRVACLDLDLNPQREDSCGSPSRPHTVEACNPQACPGAQVVPSVQNPTGHESKTRGFVPFGEPTAPRPDTAYDRLTSVTGDHCAQSYYGCCPDGHTSAKGPRNEGCPLDDCVRSRYGCCLDGVTSAQGFGRAGCPGYRAPEQHISPGRPLSGDMCSMGRDAGPCDTWQARFYYDSATSRCIEFWYGGCQGNANNFVSKDACRRKCGSATRNATAVPRRGATPRRGIRASA